jgi:putative oxidoreductase
MDDLGLLLIRLVFGLAYVGYGTQTLFGWLEGDGLDETAAFLESVGMRPGKPLARLMGVGELFAGTLFILGLFTSLAGVVMAFHMLVAIVKVTGKEAYWSSTTLQYNVAVIAATLGVALIGAGAYSLDALLGG